MLRVSPVIPLALVGFRNDAILNEIEVEAATCVGNALEIVSVSPVTAQVTPASTFEMPVQVGELVK